MGKRLRLLHLVIQPMFVIDDGENLVEQPAQAFKLAPADIANFPAKWEVDFGVLRAQVEREEPAKG